MMPGYIAKSMIVRAEVFMDTREVNKTNTCTYPANTPWSVHRWLMQSSLSPWNTNKTSHNRHTTQSMKQTKCIIIVIAYPRDKSRHCYYNISATALLLHTATCIHIYIYTHTQCSAHTGQQW